MTSPALSRLPTSGMGLLGVLGLILVACSSDPGEEPTTGEDRTQQEADIDPEPVSVQSLASEASLDDVHLPTHLTDRVTVDPQWDTPPQIHDDVFLAPGEEDGKLVFTAVHADGTTLWTAERPLSCSGFAVTTADDRPLAVLTNLTDDDATQDSLGTTTASAYDLRTGEEVWGPVDVPGPHQGPGLVFTEKPDEPMGESGQRVALDSSTGERSEHDAHLVGEFFGTIVVTDGGELLASTGDGANELWRTPVPQTFAETETSELVSPPTNRLPPGNALIGSPDEGYGLWDLAQGELLAEELDDALFDLMAEIWVGVREDELMGLDSGGEEMWSEVLGPDARLLGAGGVMAYVLTDEGDLSILNTVTGSIALVYDPLGEGATAIPVGFTDRGATVVDTGTELLLVTEAPRAESSP